jgi:hypothetical protein
MSFPQALQDITPDWLSATLGVRFPGTRVTDLRIGTVIGGMATKARLFLEYDATGRSHGLPASMWVKTGWGAHSTDFLSMNATEARFFAELAPQLPINCPKSYAELLDPDSENGLMLLEDLLLRHASFGTQSRPLEPDTMARVLALQAGYHAAFWRSPRLDQFPWLKRGGAIVATNVIDIYLGFWDTAERQPRFDKVPAVLRNRPLMRAALLRMQDNDLADACCVVHGDSHQANLYFDPDGSPGYLDWATVMRSHWAFDVSYLIVGSQSVDNRRRHEREQLRYYLDSLAANGADAPSWDDAWLAYRQHAMWMFLTAMCPTAMHPEEVCVFNTERACAAIVDLDTIESLLN